LTRILQDEKIIPKELTMPKFPEIVYGVFSACDHYESSSLSDVRRQFIKFKIFNFLIFKKIFTLVHILYSNFH
jgi:hypothetical protein